MFLLNKIFRKLPGRTGLESNPFARGTVSQKSIISNAIQPTLIGKNMGLPGPENIWACMNRKGLSWSIYFGYSHVHNTSKFSYWDRSRSSFLPHFVLGLLHIMGQFRWFVILDKTKNQSHIKDTNLPFI